MAEATRRDFLKTVGMGAAGLSLLGAPPGDRLRRGRQDRPNLLFITTDYQAGEDGPTLGSPFLRMPNLERLSREGVVFERHYCTASICMPARYTLLTGQYPHTHGQWENLGRWLPEGSPLLTEHLREAGYQTAAVGKMHFHPWDRMAGFDRWIIADRKGNTRADNRRMDDYAQFLNEHGLTRWDYLQRQAQADIFGVYDWPFHERFHIDHYVGEQAAGLIERGELRDPWFLWLSFNGPHNPWDPPPRYSDPYKRMELPGARTRPGELAENPPDHTRLRYNYTRPVVDLIDREPARREEIVHRIRAGHYGGLSFIDRQIGKVLDALERQGILADTVVLYSADHGCHLGDHHLIHKGTFYERSSRVPLVVWSPARFRPGRRRGFSTHVDLMPTLLGLAAAPAPEATGHDLTPMLTGAADSVQDQAFLEIRWTTGVVTDRWKLGVHPRDGAGELYDLDEDPNELYNRYDDSAYRQVVDELTDRLVAFHPPLGEQLRTMAPLVPVDRLEWRLDPGTHLLPEDAPDQRGRTVSVTAEIATDGERVDGPIIVTDLDGVHGYALYLRGGRLALGLRRWREDQVIVSPEVLPTSPVRVGMRLEGDGLVTLSVDGSPVSAGKAAGALPVQPGRTRVIAGHVHVGHAPGGAPMGDYDADAGFPGQIRDLTLRIE